VLEKCCRWQMKKMRVTLLTSQTVLVVIETSRFSYVCNLYYALYIDMWNSVCVFVFENNVYKFLNCLNLVFWSWYSPVFHVMHRIITTDLKINNHQVRSCLLQTFQLHPFMDFFKFNWWSMCLTSCPASVPNLPTKIFTYRRFVIS